MTTSHSLLPSDALDSIDYNPIDHLNALFASTSSLAQVAQVSRALRDYQNDLDHDIDTIVATQSAADNDSVRRIQDAKSELAELFAKIGNVQERALQTERSITDMTADIKKLDSTKKNLTLSMTALKRLQMLTTAYEQLRDLSKSRQYRDCAHLLEAVIQLMAHFRGYRSIDQIAVLSKNIADLQRELLEQVCEDFEIAFASQELVQKRTMLSEACAVVDALGEHARARLITWYCNTQLREYRQVFRGNDEAGSLDNIARRYSWFSRMLKTYDLEHASLFPAHWRVNEMLANAFCEGTREDYKNILQKSMRRADGQPPDVNLLLSCLQQTLDFEHSLEQRFSGSESRTSLDTLTDGEEKRIGFTQAISNAFEPYLSIWVESQDRQLAALVPKYRAQPIINPEEEFHNQQVIPSSTELFNQYRLTLAQCAKLSTGQRLMDLTRTFAKYLDTYAQQVLLYLLIERAGPQGPSIEDAVVIMNTADYCYQTTNQLEEKIRSRIDQEFQDKVDLQSSAEAFIAVASTAVKALVHKTEADCEPAWRSMKSIAWAKMDSVGDQSPYVGSLLQRIQDRSREILKYLHKPQYTRAYCDNLIDAVVNAYGTAIVGCRPISETGAEQLLLDSYVLKKGLAELGTLTSEPGTAPNAAFLKRVNMSTSKLDPLLKTLQVRSSPPEGLVQAYLIHIRDKSEVNFKKILDMKGITKRSDQTHLTELFTVHKNSPTNVDLPASNSYITSLVLAAPSAAGIGSLAALKDRSEAQSTPSLPARFDPSNFGSALIDAARQGVDRLGSPHLGTNTTSLASRATSPLIDGGSNGRTSEEGERGPASINGNLKNLGKFFRRDGGSFGGFGRREPTI